VRLTGAFVSEMAYVGLKQGIIIEPVVRFLELLLYSKPYQHTHGKSSVAGESLDRIGGPFA
jgi:hypothetical protein